MSQPSTDARAVVRAAEQLTTQVRRIADALSPAAVTPSPGVAVVHGRPVVATDDATTPATTCSAAYRGPNYPPGECIRAAGHLTVTDHTDDLGHSWPDAVAVYPRFDEPLRAAPAADEDAQRTARRDSLRVLFSRVQRGLALAPDESRLLVDQAETEMRDADTARVRTGKAKHAADDGRQLGRTGLRPTA
ncbi:hypothetical protein [Streptomyces shenzhenensis]|uniref:Uncharacterized protein n=1 Tax=Streptomyces shenzhenensis TaxID=943815 RepID=A0A3M0IB74_9ACTN|nr:hypothetical protein [Streptomyces shenzhenensis]RMB85608.1 hypothetical protein CTZ28_12510 [Streptomyces shenzhenensis]